jgi:hypothetical protein
MSKFFLIQFQLNEKNWLREENLVKYIIFNI